MVFTFSSDHLILQMASVQGSGVLLLSIGLLLSLSILKTWCLRENASEYLSALHATEFSTHTAYNGSKSTNKNEGKTWAVLVAGSRNYMNYRHQADVCHAYQILKNGGLKDENIIVFMYDDIASDSENPTPGVIINKPNGSDVYKGVPKDYTLGDVTINNLFAVILGNKSALLGGSGKVLSSGPNDNIFIFYSGRGDPGRVGMPDASSIYAKDLIDVLKKKHYAKEYKAMVIYLEAAFAGSMFEGLLPDQMSIYATTASNAHEISYGTYCPHHDPDLPPQYTTCLGDLFSVSWMEDCVNQDMRKETLSQQYEVVRSRTNRSHVLRYGDMKHAEDILFTYMGADPEKEKYTSIKRASQPSILSVTSQHEASLLYLQYKYESAPTGSHEKLKAQEHLLDEIAHRKHDDYSINKLEEVLFGYTDSSKFLMSVRPPGKPLVDDWDCFKNFVETYETYCGSLSTYGMQYTRAIANICNAGVTLEKMVSALHQTCSKTHQF